MRSNHMVRATVALSLAFTFAACGGSSDDDSAQPADSAEPSEPAAADEAPEPEPTEPEGEPEPAPEPTEPVTEPTEPAMPEPTEPPATTMPEPTGPADTVPADTVPPDETVSFDRNAAFRDEFDGEFLAEAGWTWVNEEPDRWRFEDGQLVITGDNPHFMGEPVNLLTRIVPDEMELGISVRVTATPQENFEGTGIMLMSDQNEYAAVLLGFCEFCLPDTGGVGIYGEAMRGEEDLLGEMTGIPHDPADPVTLSLQWSQGNEVMIAGYIDANDEYQMLFRLDEAPVFTTFGLFTHNLPMGGENTVDIEAAFDWFELKVYEP